MGYAVSPVLYKLTDSISTDTIHLMSAGGLILHLFTVDYGIPGPIVSRYLISRFLFNSNYLSVHLFVYQPIYDYISIYLSILLSINPSIYQSIYLSIHLSINPSIYQSIYLSINPFIYPSIYQSVNIKHYFYYSYKSFKG